MRASVRVRTRDGDRARPRRRRLLGGLGEALALLIGAALLLSVTAVARAGLTAPRPALTFGAGATSLASAQASAADTLAAALAEGGSGITFEVVQRSTITVRPDGPKIAVPDPVDPHTTIAQADAYFLNALTERGVASADGFYAELRAGPAPGEAPDWAAEVRLQALARDGMVYRNDGGGWYQTDSPPGIGIDPASVALLPELVRDATGAKDAGLNDLDASLRDVTATGSLDDAPGVVAADGKAFTELTGPATFSLDPDGRVVAIHLTARNTNLEAFDLVVETDIAISYGMTDALPDAAPVLADTKAEVAP